MRNYSLIYEFQDDAYNVFIKQYGNKIWASVYSGDSSLLVIDENGKLVNEYSVPYQINDFLAEDDFICFTGTDEAACLAINDDTDNLPEMNFQSIVETEDVIIAKHSIDSVTFYRIENKSPEYVSYAVHDQKTDEWIYTYSTLKFVFDDENAIVQYLNKKEYLTYNVLHVNGDAENEISAIETKDSYGSYNLFFYRDKSNLINVTGTYSHPMQSIEEITGHRFDTLCKYDIEKRKIAAEYKTRRHERIIYSDSEKAATYYKGKYYFRSLDDWSITSEIPAKEIKEGGAYTFDSCGDYIFVFNTETGELLNRISVK